MIAIRSIARTIAASAAAILLSILSSPASAGLAVSADASNPLKAAAAFTDYILEHAPGMMQPIVDYSALAGLPVKCDRLVKPRVHAILIGATDAGGPFSRLDGPDNDVALMASSLSARGVVAGDIIVLARQEANRQRVGEAIVKTLGGVNCGDHVLFYFSGNAARAADLLDFALPKQLREHYKNVSISDIWDADLYAPGDRPTAAIRWVRRAGLFLALDQQQQDVLDVLSAPDISDFVTNLRNRQVDVTVALDTSYASDADLAGRQSKVGDSTIWSIETSGLGEAEETTQEFIAQTPLLPNHGGFAAFYSSVGDLHARELGFDDPDGGRTIYGAFSFRLANVIQNRDSVTVRALAESLKTLPKVEGFQEQRYRIEANDPEMAMFTDLTALPPTDPIVITRPAPKRGAVAIERPEVDIEGVVNWSSPAKVVLVDGKVAALAPDNSFSYRAALKPGLNTLDVVALTADGRTHEKRLEFVFEGDKQALEGEGVRYALIIANQNYERGRSGFDALATPFADAEAVAAVLTAKYGFLTEAKLPDGSTVPLLLKDATRHDIETVLYKIGLVAGEKDTVLIYYAGHGIYEEKTTIAFWVPSDAEAGVPISYLSASTIAEAVQRMQANKVVIISDSCFSGALLRGGGETEPKIDDADRQRALLRLAQRRTRVLISSGNNEPVEDRGGKGHSIFAQALLTGLDDMRYDAFSARELFDGYLLPLVIANADQEPQFRPIERAGHEGGDIVFVREAR